MKKLLSILGAVSLTATGASSVIACGDGKPKPIKQLTPVVEPATTTLKEEINNEKQRKMEYFNELNNRIQKNRTEVVKKYKY